MPIIANKNVIHSKTVTGYKQTFHTYIISKSLISESEYSIFIGWCQIYKKRAMTALGRSPEYHWNQIISKSVHRFRRSSRSKLFSFYSPRGHFVQQSGTVSAIFVDSHLRNIPV